MKASEFNMYAHDYQKRVTRELLERADRLEEEAHQARRDFTQAWNDAWGEAKLSVGCRCSVTCTCGAID